MKNLFVCAVITSCVGVASAQRNVPETIFVHGKVLTGTHLRAGDMSTTPSRVAAIAVAKGRVVAVGSDAEIETLKGPETRVVDLHGAVVVPGFNDAHVHMAGAGQQKLAVDLDGTRSLAEMQERIRAYAAKAQPGVWLQGGGWDHTKWESKTLPTREDIDAVSAGHPAIFYRTDGHILVANSAALAAAGITAKTADPAGAKIDRDAKGKPTGIVREDAAIELLLKVIPPPTKEMRRRALEVAIADALSHGVTSVQDFSEWDDFLVLEEMEREGALHLRVSEWMDFNLPVETLKERRASHAADDPLLHPGMLKGFMDGSLGSRTAALAAPYTDDPGNSGIPRYRQAKLDAMAAERVAAGFQLGFHAIGDRANRMALDAFAVAETKSDDPAGLRLRIEHAQVLLPGDFDRFRSEHVIASMQPSHLLTDMNWAGARLGPERVKYSYAWRSFLTHGVVLAFGTDYPVESVNPFRGLYAAITRQNEAGTATYEPQEKISRAEAMYAYTQASAYAEFRERVKGRLEPGYLADFVVLDRDPMIAVPKDLLKTRVLRTVVGGETVYDARAASAQ